MVQVKVVTANTDVPTAAVQEAMPAVPLTLQVIFPIALLGAVAPAVPLTVAV